MPKLSDAERDEFLVTPGVLMRVSVVLADGSPWVTPIWFLYEQGALYFTPREKSLWFGCLRRDPRISLCIDEQPLPYRKVLVQGRAELVFDVGEDDQWRDMYHRIATRYVGDEGAQAYVRNTIDQPRGLYKVPLTGSRVTTWRMPVQGEDGMGIWHDRYYVPGTQF